MLAVGAGTLLPPSWVAPRVHAGEDAEEVRGRDEEHGAGEAAQQSAAHRAAHQGIALRHAGDLGEGDVDGAQELVAEAGRARLIPAGSLEDVGLGGVADDEAHASVGRAQALLEAGTDKGPALPALGLALERDETAVELSGLGRGERKPTGLGGDAVPEVLGELDALGKGESAEVGVGTVHTVSLPSAPTGSNTAVVDIGLTASVPLTHRA